MRGRGATGRDRKGPGDGAATWRGAGRVRGCAGWGGWGGRGGQSGQSCARESPQRSSQTHPSIEPAAQDQSGSMRGHAAVPLPARRPDRLR
jgi:hypothetical protein